MIFEGVELPFWSEEDQLWVIRETGEWIVAVMPVLYNDRVVASRPQFWGRHFAAGFCYDKSAGCWEAMTAALQWDPDVRRYPEGMKKVAFDARHNPPGFRADLLQTMCWLCLGDRDCPPFLRARHCAGCGACTTVGRTLPFNHATMLFATGGYLQEVRA